MADVVPLVESTPDALGSGSIVRVDDCEFRDFVGGTFVIGSFSSDVPGDGSSFFDVRSSVFVNNTGPDSPSISSTCCGGAIDIDLSANSRISIVASEFSSNNATRDGGAVNIIGGSIFDGSISDDVGSVVIDSTLFTENTASNDGGAVSVLRGDTVDIRDSTFANNNAILDGGAVSVIIGDTLDILDSTFTNNTATFSGGAIFAEDLEGGFTCEMATFIGNIVTGFGGGVSTENVGPVNFTANEFVQNEAAGRGGGFFSKDFTGNPLFTNVSNVFIDNTAPSFPNGFAEGFSNTS